MIVFCRTMVVTLPDGEALAAEELLAAELLLADELVADELVADELVAEVEEVLEVLE